MFDERPSRECQPVPAALVDLYDGLTELTDYCFFLCDALDGALSPELALEPESINGIRMSIDWVKRRARQVTRHLRDI
jgi:hypothetical protein